MRQSASASQIRARDSGMLVREGVSSGLVHPLRRAPGALSVGQQPSYDLERDRRQTDGEKGFDSGVFASLGAVHADVTLSFARVM